MNIFLRSSYHNLFKNIAYVMPMFNFNQSCICVFVYLYLGNEGVLVGELVVDVISFQKIFGLCGLKCHIMEIWTDVTLVHTRTTDGQRNVKIELEFWKQNSQYEVATSGGSGQWVSG